VEIEEQFRKHEAKLYRRIRDPLHESSASVASVNIPGRACVHFWIL
jgi:hypothetical protein